MRGKAVILNQIFDFIGITPAYAGKSSPGGTTTPPGWDHPRLCGEKLQDMMDEASMRGSPPPMRGKGKDYQLGDKVSGITPAYAGKRKQMCNFFSIP